MGSNAWTGTASEGAGVDRGAAITRSLLGYGVVAGPFYLTVGMIQALVRDGFDLARHPLSVLANGPGGWVQTANFVLTGLMVIATAVGFRRVLGPRSRGVTWFLGLFGVGMLMGALFPADPMDGFPVGTPVGNPTTISTTGLVHFAAGSLGFVSLAISCLFGARVMARRNRPGLAWLSFASGVAVIVGFFSGMVMPVIGPVLGIWFAVVVGWTWLAAMSLHLYRTTADPKGV